jgi:predicted GNAT family N-acyltransferase
MAIQRCQHQARKSSKAKPSPMKTIVRVKRVSSKSELKKAFAVRNRVFVREQGVPEVMELDCDDRRALHFLAFTGRRAVGTARVVMRAGSAKIGRMAVLKSQRKKGVGTKLLKRALTTAKQQGARRIYLHAQVAVIGFYEAAGFRCAGPIFQEAGIPHRKMIFTFRP